MASMFPYPTFSYLSVASAGYHDKVILIGISITNCKLFRNHGIRESARNSQLVWIVGEVDLDGRRRGREGV